MKEKLKELNKLKVADGKGFKLSKYRCDERFHYSDDRTLKRELESYTEKISSLQERLFANDSHSVLIVLQAIDAAGKDSCIKHVLSGVNPQGCQVVSFKQPSKEELDHDFIWRTYKQLPERGKIGVFNRSYYEEVLVCKVHPEYIISQNIPGIEQARQIDKKFWQNRYRAINEMERHLVKNGTIIIKIFLHMSKDEQKNRFIERIDNPKKRWKFSLADLNERALWDNYQSAYNDMIRETSSKYAPWYVVPSDNQWVSRAIVGQLLLEHLEELKLQYPEINALTLKSMQEARKSLMNED